MFDLESTESLARVPQSHQDSLPVSDVLPVTRKLSQKGWIKNSAFQAGKQLSMMAYRTRD
jgi:hypothetical protein